LAKKKRLFRFFAKKHKARISPTKLIAIAFAVIIALGTGLLMLPVSSAGEPAGFTDALFTATSATCVTGLVVGDTGTIWSGFGQAVIICLIEIGGLGFMSAAAMVIFLFRKKVGLRQRMLIAQALSLEDMASVVRIQKWVIFGSLTVQALGAVVLTLRFLPYGLGNAAKWGLFHSISAFCNAGFDIFGHNNSVMDFSSDPVVLITLMVLITVGGLGFFVWEELARVRRFKHFSVYTKLVLIATGVFIVGGAGVILLLEWNQPGTLGGMSTGDKILNGFFQSVTLRTAGFASFDQAALTDAGKAVSILLMLVGGSSGSTAGGLKTVTVLVLGMYVWARVRGRDTVNVFRRSVPGNKVQDAMTLVTLVVGLAVFGAIFVCATSPVSFLDSFFETASALATVGLTAGATSSLSTAAMYLIILFMYFGRVGILTISLGFLMGDKAESRFRYAQTNLLIG